MSHNLVIKLNVFDANRTYVLYPACLSLFAIYSLLNSQLVLSALLLLIVLNFKRIGNILNISNVRIFYNGTWDKLTLIIFPDGRVSLESTGKYKIEGSLDSKQWCTRHAAVIRIKRNEKLHSLVVLSVQQDKPGNFRRLNMWLRQNFYPGARAELVLGD